MAPARSVPRRRSTRVTVGTALAGVVLAVACSEPTFTYVSNTETNTFFKVPADWSIYEEQDVWSSLYVRSPTPSVMRDIDLTVWARGFDSSETPSAAHILSPAASEPAGFANVRRLEEDEREVASLAYLQNAVLPLSQIQNEAPGSVREVEREDIVLDGGFHGRRTVYDVQLPDQPTMTFTQTAVIDPAAENLYVFAVGCSAICYRSHHDVIEEVVDSWTIKEP